MSKLIKAEFYRVSHSGIFLKIFILVGLFPLVLPFTATADMEEINLHSILLIYAEMGGIVMSELVGIMLSAMISNMYQNRTYYYEIMDGANTHHTILSKLIVYSCISTVVLIIPAIITFVIAGNCYPIGDLKQLWLTVILGVVIILNFTCFTIFISMLIRHSLGGPILVYTLGMLPTFVYMLLSELSDKYKWVTDILSYIPQTQIMEFVKPEYETDFIVKVIGGFVVCFAVLYALTYASYKKKNFK